ncbi:methylated-DNA--[protein]-cysteine S-methyltransferase [Neobacillus sp. LXY-4]|uniref:methylated-DNA--[protein]-cysteine S-methyltransferase n=1 Tax=Neobacillus sp. LXY-4 TaxID=3379826 RepID=UPI003EE10B62
MRFYSKLDTIIDELYLIAEGDELSVIHLGEEDFHNNEDLDQIIYQPNHPVLLRTRKQFQEYFAGTRKEFDLPLSPQGTSFQMAVWEQLCNIPFGETRSYLEIAQSINNPKAVRAIGQANKANRYPIIIPCHRVIGKNQSLTGYAGTRIDLKEKLLRFEGSLQ